MLKYKNLAGTTAESATKPFNANRPTYLGENPIVFRPTSLNAAFSFNVITFDQTLQVYPTATV